MSTPLLFVVSAPSGGGKSTLCRALLQKRPDVHYSISCTTRPPRGSEVNGKDYVFLSRDEFQEKVRRGDFLEWAVVHDHFYGTPKEAVFGPLREGKDVLLDLDPQGAVALKKARPETVCVYVLPPSWEKLEARLRGRGQDDDATIAKRLANAREELSHVREYDYAIMNDDLDAAIEELAAILRAEHRRLGRISDELKTFEAVQKIT